MRWSERLRRQVAFGALAAGVACTSASILGPVWADAQRQDHWDTAVPIVFLVCAGMLLVRRTLLQSTLLAVAATFWSLTGMAGLLATSLEVPLGRVALVPHVCVVAAVLALPYGELAGGRGRLAGAAVAVAALAGAGVDVPALALLGVVLAVSGVVRLALGPRAPEATATGVVEVAGAAALVALELLGTDHLSVRATADWLDLVLAGAAVAVTVILGREPLAPDDLTAELGRRVAAVLGMPVVEVAFPVGDGSSGVVDTHGRRLEELSDRTPIRTADGKVVAFVSPTTSMTSGTELALAQRLLPLAAHATLNDRLRRQNDDLADSRKRLAGAANQERLRVEEALSGSVLRRLDTIAGLLDDTGASRDALARVRREIAALVEGLDPLRGRTLSRALREDLAERVSLVDAADVDVPPEVAAAAWWIIAEAVTNSLKHAAGARVVVTAATVGHELVVRVSDDGPGGADPRGRGLLGTADRAAVVDGRITIRSDSTGTTLEARFPVGKGQPLEVMRSAPDPSAVVTS